MAPRLDDAGGAAQAPSPTIGPDMQSPSHRPFPILPGLDSPSKVERLDEMVIHRGFMDFTILRLRHERFDGTLTPPIEREVCHRDYSVIIILYDAARDLLVMVEQFRAGAYAAGRDPWMLEFVAGMVEPGENAREVAIREAQEEAGCVPMNIRHIYTTIQSPGGCTETADLMFAYVDSRGLGGLHGLAEEAEDIRVHLVPAETAIRWMDEGHVASGFTLLGLNWFARHHGQLRAEAARPADNALQG